MTQPTVGIVLIAQSISSTFHVINFVLRAYVASNVLKGTFLAGFQGWYTYLETYICSSLHSGMESGIASCCSPGPENLERDYVRSLSKGFIILPSVHYALLHSQYP